MEKGRVGEYTNAHQGDDSVKMNLILAAALFIGAATPALAATDSKGESKASVQLGPNAKTLYKDVFTAIKAGQWADARTKLDAMPEGTLHGVAWAELYLAK